MDKILANIKAVPGVKGIIVIDKSRALTYELMPNSVSAEEVKNIALPLLHLGKAVNKSMSIDFFYENGVARLYNKAEQIALILGRPDLNLNALGVVCREAIPAIGRKFARGQLGISSPSRNEQQDTGLEFLLKAINIISTRCTEKIGAYAVTKNLRRAKDELTNTYSVLTMFSVDNNGTATLIKGGATQSGDEPVKAFAHWANLFLSYCAKTSDKLSPEDILKLTFEIKDRLDLSGFYQVYADSHIKLKS
jgi:predicted regulator of Ras-like GTPase activity (Roadblock/LC7/MglB family)